MFAVALMIRETRGIDFVAYPYEKKPQEIANSRDVPFELRPSVLPTARTNFKSLISDLKPFRL